jgi:aspartate kinase
MLVMKFGGTSVGSAERISAVADIIKERIEKRPVVIVSAVAGVTNSLIELAKESDKTAKAEMLEALIEHHKQIENALRISPTILDPLFADLTALTKKKGALDKARLDAYVSFGERLSSRLVAETLVLKGVESKAYDAWDLGMITDHHHADAEPLASTPAELAARISPLTHVPIITGYIGKNSKGAITTLGRGGSDYSAAVIGAALKAEAIQIWKEVDGILTTDPRLVPEARVVPELAFEEAAELAYFGAKVLHPKTILPAMKAGVPVQVLNTFNPTGSGTTIVSSFADRKEKSHSVEALTFKKGVIAIHIYSPEFFDGSGLMAQIFEVFDEFDTSVDVVSTSVASVSITTDNDEHLEHIVEELKKLGEVEVERGKAIVCAVGGSVNAAGVTGRMFNALSTENISVELISQAAGGVSITFVVNENDALLALKTLHKECISA